MVVSNLIFTAEFAGTELVTAPVLGLVVSGDTVLEALLALLFKYADFVLGFAFVLVAGAVTGAAVAGAAVVFAPPAFLYFDCACTTAFIPKKHRKPNTTNFFIPTFIEV
jgi:hypothetical protein